MDKICCLFIYILDLVQHHTLYNVKGKETTHRKALMCFRDKDKETYLKNIKQNKYIFTELIDAIFLCHSNK